MGKEKINESGFNHDEVSLKFWSFSQSSLKLLKSFANPFITLIFFAIDLSSHKIKPQALSRFSSIIYRESERKREEGKVIVTAALWRHFYGFFSLPLRLIHIRHLQAHLFHVNFILEAQMSTCSWSIKKL